MLFMHVWYCYLYLIFYENYCGLSGKEHVISPVYFTCEWSSEIYIALLTILLKTVIWKMSLSLCLPP